MTKNRLSDVMRTDKAILDFLDKWPNMEIGADYETGERTVDRVTGNVNDREWHEIGRAQSLRDALEMAMNTSAQ